MLKQIGYLFCAMFVAAAAPLSFSGTPPQTSTAPAQQAQMIKQIKPGIYRVTGAGGNSTVRGTVAGVVLSLLILGTLSNGMGLANVPGPTQTVVFGLLLIASVLIPRLGTIAAALRRVTRWRARAAGTGSA